MLSKTQSLTIAKIDFTSHRPDHPKLKELVTGFPTLVFFPAGKKEEPLLCKERMEHALVDYLEEYPSAALKVDKPKYAELSDKQIPELERRALSQIAGEFGCTVRFRSRCGALRRFSVCQIGPDQVAKSIHGPPVGSVS